MQMGVKSAPTILEDSSGTQSLFCTVPGRPFSWRFIVISPSPSELKISLTVLNLLSGGAELVVSRSPPFLAVLGLFLLSLHHVVERLSILLDADDDHGAEYDEGGNAGKKENLGSSSFLFLHARSMRERSAAVRFFCGMRLIP